MATVVPLAGIPDIAVDVVGIAGTLVLVLILVAAGGIAYKALAGDGIEWPEDVEDDDEVSRGDPDDEWKYY